MWGHIRPPCTIQPHITTMLLQARIYTFNSLSLWDIGKRFCKECAKEGKVCSIKKTCVQGVCKGGEGLFNQENVCAGVCKGGKRVCNQKNVGARKEQRRDFMRHNTTKNEKRENSVKMRDSDEYNFTQLHTT